MTVLAFTIKAHTGIRIGELGMLLGVLGGIALLLGAVTPFGKRAGQLFGGIGIAAGFICLIVATHWGHFH